MDATSNEDTIYADGFWRWNPVTKQYEEIGGGGVTEAQLAAALALKANLNSPAFTGTVTGVTKAMVGLGSAEDTADSQKPVSMPQQLALDLKQDKFIHSGIPATNAVRVFNSGSQKIRGVACTTPLTVSTTEGGEAYMTLSLDSNLGARSFTTATASGLITAGEMKTTGSSVAGDTIRTVVENTTVNGFATHYLQAPSEVAQLYVGQNGGLYVATNTNHPIRFCLNRFVTPTPALELTTAGNTNVNGDLSVGGFFSMKPWCAVLINTTNTSTGAFAVTSYGKQTITSANVTRVGAGSMAYTITFPTAHPSGTLCGVFVTPHTTGSTSWTNAYYFIPTAKIESSGAALSVWCRIPGTDQSLASGYVHGSFYVHTVP